ncbi:MAG: RDD family protein, partial [Thermoplasmata archaeon]|nr:RDD family protein [Thermoplasmata archaeon]
VEPEPTPVGRLARAFRAGVRGDLGGSLAASSRAAHEAAEQARHLLGIAEPPPDRPWQGLPVPGWVVSDQANLDASARTGTSDGRESYRGWLMARSFVQLAFHLGARRFGSAIHRAMAFAIDLTILTVPAFVVWSYLSASLHGGFEGVINNLGFIASIYGYIALAFLYFVILERAVGATPGKMLLGLAVRERGMRPLSLKAVLLRNSFRIPIFSVAGMGLSLAALFLFVRETTGEYSLGGVLLPFGAATALYLGFFVAIAIGLLGVIGFLTIAATSERQRWGDLVAGTWVVRGARPVRTPARSGPRGPGSSG